MKVLHLISGLKGGGAENMVYEICKHALAQQSLSMEVVTLSSHNDIAWKFQQAGIPVCLHHQKSPPVLLVLRSLRKILKSRPDLIHAHMFHACIIACVAKFLMPKTRVVFSLHNSKLLGVHRRILVFLTRPFRDIDILLPGTSKKWYHKYETRTIPNGVDIKLYSPLSTEQKYPVFTIIFAGRLERQKAPLFLPKLASELRKQCNFKMIVAGEGSLKYKLLRELDARGLKGTIEIRSFQDDLPQVLVRSHCLILPSDYEGMPLVLLEAGAAGLPVVATPAANQSGIVTEESGYIGERESFARILSHIVQHPEEALRKGLTLQQRVRMIYDIRHSFTAHANVYKHLLERVR
jgi:glycosyltransferase involved in cell wall biosynthesis